MRTRISLWLQAARGVAMAIAATVTLGMASLVSPAQAANPLELNFWLSGPRYDGNLAGCEAALGAISSQFAEKERRFWNSALQITGYDQVHETAYRPWHSDNIPRRFCSARAMLNDGLIRSVHYSIIEDGGLAGYNNGVEWCIVGLDRAWAHGPGCRAARP